MTAEELAKKLMDLPEKQRNLPILDQHWFEILSIQQLSFGTVITNNPHLSVDEYGRVHVTTKKVTK